MRSGMGLVAAAHSLNVQLEERVKERTTALEAQMAENRELEKTFSISAIASRSASDRTCTTASANNWSASLQCRHAPRASGKEGTIANRDASRIANMIDDSFIKPPI